MQLKSELLPESVNEIHMYLHNLGDRSNNKQCPSTRDLGPGEQRKNLENHSCIDLCINENLSSRQLRLQQADQRLSRPASTTYSGRAGLAKHQSQQTSKNAGVLSRKRSNDQSRLRSEVLTLRDQRSILTKGA